jgi:hypothetical protein
MGEERLSNLSLICIYSFTQRCASRHGYVEPHRCRNIGSLFVSSAVDRGFEPRSGQTKDNEIGIFCISAKHQLKEKEQRMVGSESE